MSSLNPYSFFPSILPVLHLLQLNFALTLEFLETAFYREALQKFSHSDFLKAGFADPFFTDIQQVFKDEQTHVNFLIGALKASNTTPTVELKYSFPIKDIKSFVTIASVLEGVGVSAYLGAAGSISDKSTLTAAGAILGVESRHTAVTTAAQGKSPIVNPFETPLGPVRRSNPFVLEGQLTYLTARTKSSPSHQHL